MVSAVSTNTGSSLGSQVTSALGYGSGINISTLVSSLVSATQQPQEDLYTSRAASVQKQISAASQVLSDFSQLSASLNAAVSQGSLQSQLIVGDGSAVSAKATAGARLSGYSGSIEVDQLAQSQSIYSATIGHAADPIGEGGMTLSVGGQSYALTIGNANNSLQGLADAINATKSGVSASIVGQGAGVRLVVKGPSGLTNAFTLAGQAGNPPSLAAFSYDGSAASPMTLAHAAQDAKFNLDGVPYSRSTNSFSDLISNVTFELKQAQPGVGLTMAVVRPTSAFSTALSQFVTAFNQMTTDMEAAQKSSPGDPVLATMQRQLRNFLAAPLTSDATYRSLNDIGIKTSQDGTISLDTAKFDAALATSPDAVEAIFSPVRDAGHTQLTDPGMAGAFGALASAQTIASSPINTYVNQLNSQSARITKQRLEMEKQMTDLQTRLTRKFGAMDAAVGAIKASQSYLTQQVAIWSKSGN